jgi:hypothetical protein
MSEERDEIADLHQLREHASDLVFEWMGKRSASGCHDESFARMMAIVKGELPEAAAAAALAHLFALGNIYDPDGAGDGTRLAGLPSRLAAVMLDLVDWKCVVGTLRAELTPAAESKAEGDGG